MLEVIRVVFFNIGQTVIISTFDLIKQLHDTSRTESLLFLLSSIQCFRLKVKKGKDNFLRSQKYYTSDSKEEKKSIVLYDICIFPAQSNIILLWSLEWQCSQEWYGEKLLDLLRNWFHCFLMVPLFSYVCVTLCKLDPNYISAITPTTWMSKSNGNNISPILYSAWSVLDKEA